MSANVSTLIDQLRSPDTAQQLAAAKALATLGRNAWPAAVALVAALRTGDGPAREWCVAALEALGPPAPSQIAELIELTGDGTPDVAYWAITLLGRAGSDAGPAAVALANIVNSSRELALRERAAWALGEMGPTASSAVEALRAAAAGKEPRLRRLAQQALDAIGP